jgi:peptidoglycan/LPS O-acetylase OafA/YrhL
MRHFPALDGLRAVAALIVIAFHYAGTAGSMLSGWLGVHVFFVLSGFLITTLALREEARTGRLALGGFWTRRAFRIVPAYLAGLTLTLVHERIVGRADFDRMVSLVPYFLTFNPEFAPPTNYLHTWTIGIEQKFYLVWPVVAFVAVMSFRKRLSIATALAMSAFVLMSVTGIAMPVHYLVLLLGCILAIVMHHARSYRFVQPLTAPWPVLGVGIAFLCFHFSIPAIRQHLSEPQTIAIYGLAVATLLPAVVAPGWLRTVLSVPPLALIGRLSYSLYLVQVLAARLVARFVPAIGYVNGTFAVVTALVGTALAALVYATVEQPFIRLGKAVAGRTSARAARPDVPVPPPGRLDAERASSER